MNPPSQQRPTTIQLFATCLVDSLFPEVGEAVVLTLNRAGIAVEFPAGQTCCGQPAYNAGFHEEARHMALHTLQVFEAAPGPVVIPSGSCAGMIQHGYAELFADDPANLQRARNLAARCYEYSQFLVDVLGITQIPAPSIKGPARLAYHPACHALRALGIDRQPQALLQGAGCQVQRLAADCCGFGGLFSVDQAEISGEMLERKLQAIEESGAETVVSVDVSCLMQIEGGLRRRGSNVRCQHLAQTLAGKEPGLR